MATVRVIHVYEWSGLNIKEFIWHTRKQAEVPETVETARGSA